MLGGSIVAITQFWCLIMGQDYMDKLHNILPPDISSL
jgi:hypothetical protein